MILIYTYINSYRDINIYSATVPDRMHHLDLGLFHWQIEFILELLRLQHDNKLVDKLDYRLATISRYLELKVFLKGLQSITRLTANEYRSLIKVMIFVMDNLYENNKTMKNFISNKNLMKLYESWNKIYILSRSEEFSESNLTKFQVIKNY